MTCQANDRRHLTAILSGFLLLPIFRLNLPDRILFPSLFFLEYRRSFLFLFFFFVCFFFSLLLTTREFGSWIRAGGELDEMQDYTLASSVELEAVTIQSWLKGYFFLRF